METDRTDLNTAMGGTQDHPSTQPLTLKANTKLNMTPQIEPNHPAVTTTGVTILTAATTVTGATILEATTQEVTTPEDTMETEVTTTPIVDKAKEATTAITETTGTITPRNPSRIE